ncbi:hypothetical protein B0H13DRAFT_1852254 [Mycena leptocephala]|nr:hypothetical protein B0H13DRAFT_1852254 [Mycena leptocephala]
MNVMTKEGLVLSCLNAGEAMKGGGVVKDVPTKTDSDSDDDVVPPPEPAVKVIAENKASLGATKVVLPKTQRRNVVKRVPTVQSTTHPDSEPPEQTVKVPTFILDSDLFLTGHRIQSLAELSRRAWEKLEFVAPRRSARSARSLNYVQPTQFEQLERVAQLNFDDALTPLYPDGGWD